MQSILGIYCLIAYNVREFFLSVYLSIYLLYPDDTL